MSPENLGKMILKLRKKTGLTQSELAEMLNVSDKAVSKWENGQGYPEITQLPMLSKIFGVSVDYLLKGNPKGIVVAGNILADIVNIIDKYPEKTMLCNISDSVRAVGGCVPNTIIDLAKIDSELSLSAVGKVGNDEHGRYVISQMQKYGVDTSRVAVSNNLPTSTTQVMSERVSGERTFFHTRGANADFDISDIDIDKLDCEIFHIGYVFLLDKLDSEDKEYGTKMARLLCEVSKKGIKTSLDAVSSDSEDFSRKLIPALKYCDYVIMNELEACMISGLSPYDKDGRVDIENIKKTMNEMIGYGVREKVIVHCKDAGFMMTSDGEFLVSPSLCLPNEYIKGSVGAGDAYAAGSLYGIYNGFDNDKILEFAAAVAACSLSESDSISGMKSRAEIEKLNTIYKRREL